MEPDSQCARDLDRSGAFCCGGRQATDALSGSWLAGIEDHWPDRYGDQICHSPSLWWQAGRAVAQGILISPDLTCQQHRDVS